MFAHRTDFQHNFRLSRWPSWYFPGCSLSGSKNETSRLLSYKIFWWKKNYIIQKFQEHCSKKTLDSCFQNLRFAEYWQLTKPCWGKKNLKRKTLRGIGNVNKKIIKTRWSNLASGTISSLLSTARKRDK